MAKVFIEETTLTAIGDAIRGKTGKTELIDPANMGAEIEAIEAGSGGGAEVPDIVLTGNCDYGCMGAIASAFIENFPDAVTTNNMTSAVELFRNSTLTEIPFDLNYKCPASGVGLGRMFDGAKKLESIPKMLNVRPMTMMNLFYNCERLRYIPEDLTDTWDWSVIENYTSAYSGDMSSMFTNCYSLRKVPADLIAHGNPYSNYSYSLYKGTFTKCYVLDEIANIGVPYTKATWTSNAFSNFVTTAHRLKRLTFALNPETNQPYQVSWKSQTIDLSSSQIGYEYNVNSVENYKDKLTDPTATGITLFTFRYNAGLDPSKMIYDEATYQAYKNDPDSFVVSNSSNTCPYSRYNHDSAVETLNSLPDTSAYLASAGGTNTIKFRGNLGSATDGGAINTLTDAEIAVATAKGWTVTFV